MVVISAPVKPFKQLKQCLKAQIRNKWGYPRGVQSGSYNVQFSIRPKAKCLQSLHTCIISENICHGGLPHFSHPLFCYVRCKLESWWHLSEQGVVLGGGGRGCHVPDVLRGTRGGAWRPLASRVSERSYLSQPPQQLTLISSSQKPKTTSTTSYLVIISHHHIEFRNSATIKFLFASNYITHMS